MKVSPLARNKQKYVFQQVENIQNRFELMERTRTNFPNFPKLIHLLSPKLVLLIFLKFSSIHFVMHIVIYLKFEVVI